MSLILLATPFLKHHRGLLAFLPISIHWWLTIISLSPAAKLLSTWSSLACANHEVVPRPVQVFPSVELHDVPVQSLPQPIDVPLNGSTTLWWCLPSRFVSSAHLLRVFTVIQVNINMNDFILIPEVHWLWIASNWNLCHWSQSLEPDISARFKDTWLST